MSTRALQREYSLEQLPYKKQNIHGFKKEEDRHIPKRKKEKKTNHKNKRKSCQQTQHKKLRMNNTHRPYHKLGLKSWVPED